MFTLWFFIFSDFGPVHDLSKVFDVGVVILQQTCLNIDNGEQDVYLATVIKHAPQVMHYKPGAYIRQYGIYRELN